MSVDERRPLLVQPNPNWDRGPFVPQNSNSSNNGIHRSQPRSVNGSNTYTPSNNVSIPASTEGTVLSSSPANSRQVIGACVAILVAVVLERISYYGLTGNIVLFLNEDPFTWQSYNAMNSLFLFFGITFLLAFVGGWIADSCLGRFKTMLIAFIIYICGYMLFPFIAENREYEIVNNTRNSSSPIFHMPAICAEGDEGNLHVDSPFKEKCAWIIYIALLIVALGNGMLKANIVPFGSDQLSRTNQYTHVTFFNWFYWCVNLGSFIGLSAITYVEQQVSFHLGYIICTVTLTSAALIFLTGRFCYVTRPPDGSVFTNIFRIIQEAWRRKRQRKQLYRSSLAASDSVENEVDSALSTEEKINFLDYAKHRYGGMFHNSLVDDVKKLKMILAVFAVLIPYWIVYYQMQTTFLFQGLHMRLGFNSHPANRNITTDQDSAPPSPSNNSDSDKPQIVAAWFTLLDALSVIILLPLFDRVIYPRMARAGYPFTFTKRIVIGMVCAMAAMFVAGIVEHFRLQAFWPYPDYPCVNNSLNQRIGITTYEAADMSIFWQIPQYVLIGISEVFASVAGLQFAVALAPKSMKAITTGVFYLSSGLGSLLGTAIMSTLSFSKIWFSNENYGNINCRLPCTKEDPVVRHSCHLDYYFYLLGVIELVALVLFIIVAYRFKLNSDELALNTRVSNETSVARHVQRRATTHS